jgi:hypothetical protein
MAGTGGVLVRTHDRGVDPDRPLRAFARVGITAQPVQDLFPRAIG